MTPAQFLAKKMLPDEFKPIARNLFDAIRNGIAHGYETKSIRIGDKPLDIGISWRQQPHLQFSPDKKVLYLNVQTMSKQILDLLEEYETLLVAEPQLRMQFSKAMRISWTEKLNDAELKAWMKLLGDAM